MLRFYFDALQFASLAESFAPHSIFDVTIEGGAGARDTEPACRQSAKLCIRNVVPAEFLRKRFTAARTATLFSATLAPADFYRDMLGTPDATGSLDVESPFAAAQLRVRIVDHVPTAYAKRTRSLEPIAEVIGEQYAAAPGNYLAFFSSFDYLQSAFDTFHARYPQVPVWRQHREMDDDGRARFLGRLVPDGSGIGFAVLGGSFAEGIDLPGGRLIGAFVTTLGMPQFNPVNERMKQTLQDAFGAGHAYTYLYPGMRKVVQAAGRVIRTMEDKGHLILIDPRFGRASVRALMPKWWAPERYQQGAKTNRAHAPLPAATRVQP